MVFFNTNMTFESKHPIAIATNIFCGKLFKFNIYINYPEQTCNGQQKMDT